MTHVQIVLLITAASDRDPRVWADALARQLQADLSECGDDVSVEVSDADYVSAPEAPAGAPAPRPSSGDPTAEGEPAERSE